MLVKVGSRYYCCVNENEKKFSIILAESANNAGIQIIGRCK